MLFFSNDIGKLQTLGFKTTKTIADADVAVFLGKNLLTEAKSAALQKKICFIIDAEGELGFFDTACLAFSDIIILKNVDAVKAVVKYLDESQTVNASGNEETGHEEQPDLVASLFGTTREGLCPKQESDELHENVDELSGTETIEEYPEPLRKLTPLPCSIANPKRLVAPTNSKVFTNIFASYSPSTSVGKTFIAVNATVWLARRGVKVALVDLDPDKVDLWHTSYMDAFGPPRVTVSNWVDIVGDPVQHISQHPTLSNLYVLPGTTVVGGPLPDASVVKEILHTLAERFDVVFADLNALLRLTHIVTALSMAGKIFLLSDLSEKCVSQTSMIFSQASKIAGHDRMIMVINRVQRGQLYRPRDIAKMFGFAEYLEIPDDPKTVMSCLKSRRFPVDTASPVGTALIKCFGKELAGLGLADEYEEPKTSMWKGLLNLRRGLQ
ncbi:AAA family ATPase [Desulfoscipio gibsoniae]